MEIKPSIVQNSRKSHLHSDTSRNIGSVLSPYTYDYGKSSVKLVEMERETTSTQHMLNAQKSNYGNHMPYYDNAKNTMKQTTIGLTDTSRNILPTVVNGQSNTGLTTWSPKDTQKQTTIFNNYSRPINKKDGMAYIVANFNAKTTNKETTIQNNYINHANDINKDHMVYSTFQDPQKIRYQIHAEDYKGHGSRYINETEIRNQYYNANISDTKEQFISKNDSQVHRGTNSSLGKINAGYIGDIKSTDNLLFKERPNYRIATNIGNISNNIPSISQIGEQTEQRIDYSQIDRFNNNTLLHHNRFDSDVITQQLAQNPFYNIKRKLN